MMGAGPGVNADLCRLRKPDLGRCPESGLAVLDNQQKILGRIV